MGLKEWFIKLFAKKYINKLKEQFDMLAGKKTYVVAILTIIYAWAGFFANLHSLDVAINLTLGSAGLGALRAGVAKAE